jgi:hypothetical protein
VTVSSGRAGAGGGQQQRETAAGTTPYYAQAFARIPGQCFRLISRGTSSMANAQS